jgi:hypothetical protein
MIGVIIALLVVALIAAIRSVERWPIGHRPSRWQRRQWRRERNRIQLARRNRA